MRTMRVLSIISLLFIIGTFAADGFAQSKTGSQPNQSKQKLPRSVLNPGLWERVDVQAPPECDDWPEGCAKQFLKRAGIELSGSPKIDVYRIGESEAGNLTVVLVTTKVDEDDSVSGIRYRLAMSLGDVEDNTFKLETLGRQYTCWRGRKTWSKKLCP